MLGLKRSSAACYLCDSGGLTCLSGVCDSVKEYGVGREGKRSWGEGMVSVSVSGNFDTKNIHTNTEPGT